MTKKIAAFLTCAAMLFSSIPVYAIKYDEYMAEREQYMSASYEISPGLTYTETLTKNEKYGYERAYIYEYTPNMGTQIIPSCGDYVYGTESLGTLTKRLEDEGKRVVGGINGDFYSTSTGVPIGAMIIDGEIITSDNDRTAMGFDENGNAFISKPGIVTKLLGDGIDINIEHINKYPLEYSLYLLTDKFYPTTKTTKASAEIVLMPYSESKTYLTEEEMQKDEEIIENKEETSDADGTDQEKKEKFVYVYPLEEETLAEESENPEETEETVEAELSEATEVSEETEETEETEEIEAAETPEEPEETENVEDIGASEDSENEEVLSAKQPSYFAKRYAFADERLKIGSSIKVVVTEIRKDSINSKIPEGCFVLCAENELQYERIKELSLGSELEISVTANEDWYGAVNAIGNSGGLILKDSEYCDDVEIDHYPYAHPRTAAGITADGRVIFYCVDGRQQNSAGLRIDQLSHEMKELGCVIAMNLDGGGSTTAYAALPGNEFSSLVNSPSVSPERRTANSLIFVNTTEKLDEVWRYTIFPENLYVLAGGSKYTLSAPIPIDKNFYPVDLPEEIEYEYYTSPVATDSVIIDGNTFVSGEKSGICSIYLKVYDGETEKHFKAGHIFVLESPEDFSLGEEEYTISPFETVKFDFNAEYHTADIVYDKASLRWQLPDEAEKSEESEATQDTEDIGGENTEAENSEQQDQEKDIADIVYPEEGKEYLPILSDEGIENEKFHLSPELEITPKVQGQTLIVKAKIGTVEKEIKFNIKEFPFTDSFSHWSAKSLYDIHSFGIMKGEADGEGYAFFPQRTLTKAEFITILARILYPDIDEEKEEVIPESENGKDVETVQNTEITEEPELPSDDGNDETPDTEEPEQTGETEEQKETEEIQTEVAETFEEENTSEHIAFEEIPTFDDWQDIPDWALKYYEAILPSGLLELVAAKDETSNAFIDPNEKITRKDVLTLLGALCDEAKADFVGAFTDTQELYSSHNISFINNALSAGIFEGYEDGSLRAEGELTRAESATVILRFLENRATE
ncbi:MAG: hypothetical protein E7621_03130 [Ruminococcaceae bacterium]|nr:hypothetical protein [Oscillospiraceae bacterium]